MERPYITCHMVCSLDGKVTGDFLGGAACTRATDLYYRLNREAMENGEEGYICGRVTMEGSFTHGFYPELAAYEPLADREDFLSDLLTLESRFFAVAFDTHGKLGWTENRIQDEDPGYGGARIVEILSEDVDGRYLSYLRRLDIPYLFAGKAEIDITTALKKLYTLCGTRRLLLEGGSVINGAFLRANAVDALSLVIAPTVADGGGKPLFFDAVAYPFALKDGVRDGEVLLLRYERKDT